MFGKDALEIFPTANPTPPPPSNNTSSETAAVSLQQASLYTARDNKHLNPHIKLSGVSLSVRLMNTEVFLLAICCVVETALKL